jgi:hypothetical protein
MTASSRRGETNPVAEIYRFRVSGHLDDRWSDWLDGLVIERQADGTTVLTGPVVDQAALHGVIGRIRDLGLPLLSVNRVNRIDRFRSQNEQFARSGGESA